MNEFWVVSEWAWMDEMGSGVDRGWCATLPTLAAAKRWGLREFGHDDFTIAVVNRAQRRLVQYTWMGEDRGDTPEDLAAIAASLDLTPTNEKD